MIISWNITKQCNLYCDHCYRDSDQKQYDNELTTEEGIKLIDEIAGAGFKILILSGGEPLMRKDIFELASYAKSIGLKPVVGTNGTLITSEVARQMKASGIEAVAVSIDDLSDEKHDTFRHSPGAFNKAIKGIEYCIRSGIRVQINTTVTKANQESILKITDLARSIGASSHHPFFLVEVGRGNNLEHLALENKEYMDLIHDILDKQVSSELELKPTCAPQFMAIARQKNINMRFTRGCIAGIGYCCILPNGDVHICPYLPVKVGNVKEDSFDRIWRDSETFNDLRDFNKYKGKCGECANISICGGCRARAFKKSGDYLEEDPVADQCYMNSGGRFE